MNPTTYNKSASRQGSSFHGQVIAPVRGAACNDMDWKGVFDYDSASGILFWATIPRESFASVKAWSAYHKRMGKPAGHSHWQNDRRHAVVIGYNNRIVFAHRVIWEIHFGQVPIGMEIDHKDGNPFNNRIGNLRLATHAQNNQNKGIQRNSSTGVKGVYLHKAGRYRAEIKANGVRVHLGLFDSVEDARIAYVAASIKYHGEYGRV